MFSRLVDLGVIVGVLASVKYFILDSLNLSVTLTSEATITAIVCSTIVFIAIVIPFILRRK